MGYRGFFNCKESVRILTMSSAKFEAGFCGSAPLREFGYKADNTIPL